jgi:alpha-glucoside transport system permease protein
MNPALQGLITIIVGVGGCISYFYLSNLFLDKVLFPIRGVHAGRNISRANMIRPWLFLAPAIFAMSVYLAYPVFETFRLSLMQRVAGGGYEFVGLQNYQKMLQETKFWEALHNNLLWLLVVPAASTGFGLLAAQLSDRISWGNLAKSLIFMPMAISFVGAAVIWKLVYDTRGVDQDQIGILNAVWLHFKGGPISVLFLQIVPSLALIGFAAAVAYLGWALLRPLLAGRDLVIWAVPLRAIAAAVAAWLIWLSLRATLNIATADLPYGAPQTWLTIPFWNSFFLMAVLIWIQTGFAMVILSAALRGVPEDTIEAAIVDGANPFQIFFKIKVPQIMGTIVVVWTTITIVVLKVFDIVYAMSNGQWETQVLANYMYDKLFRANDWGIGSASAMVIMLLVMPILIWNVYNARKEMR